MAAGARGLIKCKPEAGLLGSWATASLVPGQGTAVGPRPSLGAQKGQESRPQASLFSHRKGMFGAFFHFR